MKKYLLFILLCLSVPALAQRWGWTKALSSTDGAADPSSVAISPDKHIYVAGIVAYNLRVGAYPNPFYRDTVYPGHYEDGYLAKFDTLGNLNWLVKTGWYQCYNSDVTTDKQNNVYISTNSTGSYIAPRKDTIRFTSTDYYVKHSTGAACLVKYDKNGNYLWADVMEGKVNNLSPKIISVKTDKNQNVYVFGQMDSVLVFRDTTIVSPYWYDPNNQTVSNNAFIVKYDKDGHRQFFREYYDFHGVTPYAFDVDPNGNIYVACQTLNNIEYGTGNINLSQEGTVFMKLDPYGIPVWSYPTTGLSRIFDLKLDEDGNVYCTGFMSISAVSGPGFTVQPTSNASVLFLKLDKNGNFKWVKRPGTSSGNHSTEMGYNVYPNNKGYVYLSGTFATGITVDTVNVPLVPFHRVGDSFIAKYDTLGNVHWIKTFGAVLATEPDTYLDGFNDQVITASRIDMYQGGFPDYEDGTQIPDYDNASNWQTMIRPIYDCNADINYSNGSLSANQGISYKWYLNGVQISNANQQQYIPSVSGEYRVEVTFSATCKSLSNALNYNITGLEGQQQVSGINLYPNPAEDVLNVEAISKNADMQAYKIYNATGAVVKEASLGAGTEEFKASISVEDLPSGLYLMELSGKGAGITQRFVKK